MHYRKLQHMLKLYEFILFPWVAIAIIVFFILLKINAPYGKFFTFNLGVSLPYKLGWFIQEIISPIALLLFYLTGTNDSNIINIFFISLWVGHYIYRSIFFPFRIKKNTRRIPLLIVLSAVLFNSVNGFINGYYLGNLAYYSESYLFTWKFIFGFLLFSIGIFINIKADNILISIRSNNDGYKIPNGFIYKYISCPNYFGEMIEWLGFAVMTFSIPGFVFFIWTVANLLPRAIATHKWYKEKFDDYPLKRKILIPFIF